MVLEESNECRVDALSAWKRIILSLQYYINQIKKSPSLAESRWKWTVYKHFVEWGKEEVSL